MRAGQRRDAIADLARADRRVTVRDLTERFEVNAETIRRDLVALEEQGIVQRVHAGAVLRTTVTMEPRVALRATEHFEVKAAIAQAAVEEIPAYGTVFVEAGSTTALLVDHIASRSDLLVVTNALQTALALAETGVCTVMTIGGRVRGASYAEVDAWALERLAGLRFEVAFIGTNAIDAAWGLSTPDPAEAAVKAAIVRSAHRSVLLADHSKFGLQAGCRYAEVDDIDLIITDQGVPDRVLEELNHREVSVRCVQR